MKTCINIIALNIPYPPNYGGVIDIYYKLSALKQLGAGIILHCFEYDRQPAPALNDLCEEVYYYKRNTGLPANAAILPYNVNSRRDPQLLRNLMSNDYPILFEGLHSCYYLNHKQLRQRLKIYRASNIEHDYYRCLARACRGFVPKAFHFIEAWRFEHYQSVLNSADVILPISQTDTDYLSKTFPNKQVEFIPAFHAHEKISSPAGSSDFILYHAKLSVYENELAALYLVNNVFSHLEANCVIAGMNPSARLQKAVKQYPHIRIESNPSPELMEDLMRNAHIHLLPTFQPTGLKLKLLNSLFEGRHLIVNSAMLSGSGLESLCHIAETPAEMINSCKLLLQMPFDEEEIRKREQHLLPFYTSSYQAKRILEIISLH